MIELNLIDEKSEIDTLKEDVQRLKNKGYAQKDDIRRLKRKNDDLLHDNFRLKSEKASAKHAAKLWMIAFFTSLAVQAIYAIGMIF